MGSAQEPLERAASGLAEVGAGEGLEEASLPDGSGVLDAAEQAPAGAACWTTGWSRAGVGRRDGVEAGVGWGDGVEPVDAAERAPAGAACWTQPNGRRPRRRAGCRRASIGRATGWRRASTGGDVVDGASAGAVEWIRASGVGRPVSGYDGSGRRAGRQTQGRRGGCRARGLEWRQGGCRARGLEWP